MHGRGVAARVGAPATRDGVMEMVLDLEALKRDLKKALSEPLTEEELQRAWEELARLKPEPFGPSVAVFKKPKGK